MILYGCRRQWRNFLFLGITTDLPGFHGKIFNDNRARARPATRGVDRPIAGQAPENRRDSGGFPRKAGTRPEKPPPGTPNHRPARLVSMTFTSQGEDDSWGA